MLNVPNNSISILKQINTKYETRGQRILNAALRGDQISNKGRYELKHPVVKRNKSILDFKQWDSFESTKGLTEKERQTAVEELKIYVCQESEPSTHSLKSPVPVTVQYSDSSDQEISCSTFTPFADITYIANRTKQVTRSNVFQETLYSKKKSKQLQNTEHNKYFICEQDKDTSIISSLNCNTGNQNYDCHAIENSYKDPEYVPDSDDSDSMSEASTSPQSYSTPVETDTRSLNSLVYKNKLHKFDVGGSSEKNNSLNTNSKTLERSWSIESYNTGNNSKENTISRLDKAIDKPKRVRRKDFCFYCETLVTTFARHILRNHYYEIDVQKIHSKHINSKERKELIALLRKKGNYLYSTTNEAKPVRTPSLSNTSNSVLPCSFCLGFYSRKLLWRHRKICSQNPGRHSKESSQAAGQSCLVRDINVNSKIYKQVFPRMRADEISLTAKKDPLICSYGSRFLLTHRSKHHVNVISRKMRELAKLLNEVKRIQPRISSLLQALKPEHFDVLVEAAKVAASYDVESDTYSAPTYAMNISTSLKECCEIGITYALKKKHCFGGQSAAEAEAELRTTIILLKSNWKFEVSHQAANNLYFNKMNKITIVPLASDLKVFKDYLVREGNNAATTLLNDQCNLPAYRKLLETSYCRVLLLCRKRVGELQRIPLDLYQKNSHNHSYEEFENLLSPIEIMLIRKFKRVVIQGKRKVTPVLFSFDVQNHIDLLIALRHNFVPNDNIYLFANANTSNPIIGYKVLQKHAKIAGLKNPEALTSRTLRKHLATISQLFQMNDNDIEQLALFMGHTTLVHRNEYRLPDDVFQTAKIAKLLLAMESGDGVKNKGKTLDEMDVNIEENLLESINTKGLNNKDVSDDEDEDLIPLREITEGKKPSAESENRKNIGVSKKPKKREFTKWTQEEKNVVFNFFKTHIERGKPPRKYECEKLMSQYHALFKNKTWVKIKVLVQNIYTQKTRIQQDK